MNQIVLSGIQIALSMWEMWICYKFLYLLVLDENDISKIEKIMMWCNIIFIGGLAGVNRLDAFFSSPILFFQIIMTVVFLNQRKNKILIIGSVILSLVVIAILDMTFAFLSFEFLGKDFYSTIYVYAMTWEKEVIFLLSRGIMYLCIFVLKDKTRSIQEVAEQCKYIILGMGIILGILLLRYQWLLDGMVAGNVSMEGAATSISLLFATFLIVFIGIFITKYYYMKQEKEALLLREQLLEERYVEIMKNHQMLHDMKNHFLLLQKYEREGNLVELHNYLKDINKEMTVDISRVWSGNAVVDMILNSKKAQAEKLGIKVNIDSEMIVTFPLTNRESISLFGNLLDNSIEACERMQSSNKWISINMKKKNQLLCIQIDNSMEGMPKEKNGRIISVKKDKGIHGYGLKNVRQIINNHDGIYSYKISENNFLTVITFFANEYIS